MRYDFDMFSVDNARVNRGIVSNNARTNLGALRTNHVIAVFRDSGTVEAVMQAPPIIRLFLQEAGFGLKVAPDCQFGTGDHSEDPRMRHLLVDQLSTALANRAMKKALARVAHESSFNVHDFIASVVAKDPSDPKIETDIEMPDVKSDMKVKPRRPTVKPKSTRRRVRPN
jgi:hypothetical protein